MKRPTRRALGQAGWTLAIAGGLAVTAATTAQISPYLPVARTSPTPQAAKAETPGPVADDYGHLAVVKVELAWLADPATFPHPLEARMTGTVLEVRGDVPNESVRQQALRLAREESGMRVMDGLKIHHKLELPAVDKPSGWLHQQAIAAIHQTLPQCAGGITVATWTDGQVAVKGTVPTYEEKLAASRCLRRVSGCHCVINQLSVLVPYKDWASARSRQKQNLDSDPVPGRGVTAQSAAVSMLPTEPIRISAGDSAGSAPSSAQTSQAGLSTATNLAGAEGTTEEKPARKIMAYTAKWRRLGVTASSSASNEAATPPKPEPAIVEARVGTGDNRGNGEQPPFPLLPPVRRFSVNDKATIGQQVTDRKQAVVNAGYSYPTSSGSKEVAPTLSQPPRSGLVPATYVKEPEAIAGMEYSAQRASTATTTVKSPYPLVTYPSHLVPATAQDSHPSAKTSAVVATVKPPSSVSPAASAKGPTVARRGVSYVTTGVVVFETPVTVVQPLVKTTVVQPLVKTTRPAEKPPFQSPLQKHIAAACGKAAQDVEITSLADKTLRVRIQAHSAQEGDQIAAKVFQMPELAPYQVALDVPVMP